MTLIELSIIRSSQIYVSTSRNTKSKKDHSIDVLLSDHLIHLIFRVLFLYIDYILNLIPKNELASVPQNFPDPLLDIWKVLLFLLWDPFWQTSTFRRLLRSIFFHLFWVNSEYEVNLSKFDFMNDHMWDNTYQGI